MSTSKESSSDPELSGRSPSVADVPPAALVQVGFVFRPHGMKGELKIDPASTDDPARFEELSTVFVGAEPHRVTRHAVVSVRYQQTKRGTTVILGLEGIEDRDEAEAVTKFNVFATEEALELGDEEIFAHELVGWAVMTEGREELGTVGNFMQMPAQDMLVVIGEDGGETMIPAVDDFILAIDEENEQIIVRPIEGLLGE